MKLTPLLIFLFFSTLSFAQKVTLFAGKYFAKWPMENGFSFSVKNIPCNAVVFKTNNGKIIHQGCNLYYTPDTLKETFFTAYKKMNGKLKPIDTIKIFVQQNYPAIQIGIKLRGELTKTELVKFGGVIVKLFVTEYHSELTTVNSFRIITIRSDTVESCLNYGYRFTVESLALINKLCPKDKILFTDIKTSMGELQVEAIPTEFTIKQE